MIAVACVLLAACGEATSPDTPAAVAGDPDGFAREYLLLELGMGRHDADHVDAYFGPPELKEQAESLRLSLEELDERAAALLRALDERGQRENDPSVARRLAGLTHRLGALRTRIAINQERFLPFDEESRRLFGAVAPDHDAAHFEAILDRIDALLPGAGDLSARVNAFRERFVVPPDRLPAVLDAAIAECRRRTLEHMTLPEAESFRLEYVEDKPWSGYNWYRGDSESLIQINTDLPIYISRAVDLGCHEGYPGHHTFNLLLEKNLVDGRGWLEFTLYPLFSPQSLIAEGSGNYGIELAFPGDERVRFEQERLFPLASLDPADADRYYELLELLDELAYAGNEAARDYLNGDIDREAAVAWLIDYALYSPERARQRVDFIETYRSYVINYNLGQDMVREFVERGGADEAERWARFTRMLSSPMLPADLRD